METRPIDDKTATWLILSTEENCGGEDALKALYESPIMASVLGKAEEIQHSGGAVEVDDATLLLDGERRDPNRDKTILPKGQAKSGMASDVEKEFSIAPAMCQLVLWRAAKWNAAKNKRPSVVASSCLPFCRSSRMRLTASICLSLNFVTPMDGNAHLSDAQDVSLATASLGFGPSMTPVSVC